MYLLIKLKIRRIKYPNLFSFKLFLGFSMKFTNSPFAILDKNMNALDYQKRNLIYEDYWRREGFFQKLHKESE